MARDIARTAASAALLVAGASAIGGAQPRMNRGPNADAPHLMVSACRTPDKVLAVLCGDRIRSQIEGDVSYRSLYVHPKSDVEGTLTASGYDPAVALAPADAMALAKNIRADMYVDATVEKVGAGFKLTAGVVLSRDANMVQPLGVYENGRIETVVAQASKAFQEVFNRTFTNQKECFTFARERKIAEANKRIADGIRDYPKSTWLRHCNLGMLKDQKSPQAQVLKVAEELRDLDPANKSVLRDLVLMYDATGNKEKKVVTLEALLSADPGDARLTADIINELASMGNFDKALPLAEKAVAQFQGDLNIIRPYWLILTAKQRYKMAIEVGKQMVTLDTAAADSLYFVKQMTAANADSNFALAAEFADQGGMKFPKGEFNTFAAGLWRKAGNTQKSVAASRRALAADPKATNARAAIATALLQENPAKVDEAIGIIKEMIAAGEDKTQIAGLAVAAGNALRTQVDSMRARGADAAALQAANEHAYQTLAWADTLASGTSATVQQTTKFVMGVSAMAVGQGHLVMGGDIVRKVVDEVRAMRPPPDAARQRAILDPEYAKACVQIDKANDYLSVAQLAVTAGARSNPQAAQQVMGIMQSLNGSVEQMKRVYCNRAGRPGDTARAKPAGKP